MEKQTPGNDVVNWILTTLRTKLLKATQSNLHFELSLSAIHTINVSMHTFHVLKLLNATAISVPL